MGLTNAIPTAAGRVPLLGHSLMALRDPLGFVAGLDGQAPIVRVFLGPVQAYVLTTPELVAELSVADPASLQRNDLRDAIAALAAGSSNVLSGAAHTTRRRMIAPLFKAARLEQYSTTVEQLAQEWARGLPAGEPFDVVDSVRSLVLTTLTSTLIRSELAESARAVVQQHIPWLLGEVIMRGALPPQIRWLRPYANWRFRTRAAVVRAALADVVRAYRAQGIDHNDLLSALVGYADPETGARLSDDDVIDEAIVILSAGAGSQSAILSWLIHEITTRPEVCERVQAELNGPEESLPYLHAVLFETLRYWGPWVSSQAAATEITIGGQTFAPGTTVMFSPYLVHHSAAHYEDPERFNPQRWLGAAPDRRAVLYYGAGHRFCPGNHFATRSMIIQAAALLRTWAVSRPSGKPVRPANKDFVMSPSAVTVLLSARAQV